MKTATTKWEDWPALENDEEQRVIYVANSTKKERQELIDKRYIPVDVTRLSRTNDEEHRIALEGWLQGMVEGSISNDPERRKTIELELRERGLLVNRTMKLEARVSDQATLEKLLSFGETRYTLNRASNSKLLAAREAARQLPSASFELTAKLDPEKVQ